ncbi:Nucleoside phosphatase [Trachipleistophora hominis]|uniref:Nucleoside phosphatase n=1 Tax=Trachipleistophora hominis TaxID=72359 RepID=L7K0K3_TRAHO|nr:Nucleoside phosphatase [Trachipleistophora hominis]
MFQHALKLQTKRNLQMLLFAPFILAKQFVVILDAGFTSTKLNVYTFSDMIVVSSYTRFYHPGVHELRMNEIEHMIECMLSDARKFVEENGGDVHRTRIALVATEGLRSLGRTCADVILRCIKGLIDRSGFVSGRHSVSVMDGVFEGLYAYEALVYLLFLRDNKDILGEQLVDRYRKNKTRRDDEVGRSDRNAVRVSKNWWNEKKNNGQSTENRDKKTASDNTQDNITDSSNKLTHENRTAVISKVGQQEETGDAKTGKKKLHGWYFFKAKSGENTSKNNLNELKNTEENEFDKVTYLKPRNNTTSSIKSENYLQREHSTTSHSLTTNSKLSLGIIEMGGGSMQIAFSTNVGNKYQLFIHSFHNLGLIKGMNELLSLNLLERCRDLKDECVHCIREHFNLNEFVRAAPLHSVHKFYLLSFFYDRLSEYQPIRKFDDIINVYKTRCVRRTKNCNDLEYMVLVLKGIGLKGDTRVEIGRMIDDKNLNWGLAKALEMLIG